jgi:fibronectin-binding autotransporter adhesin
VEIIKIHTFTGPGTFTVSSVGNPAGSSTVQTLIVAGGGGGGRDRGSGGGAGGLILTPCAGIPVSATAYPISIGGGGPGGTSPFCGTQGTPTTGFSLTSVGGGKGSGGGGAFPVSVTTGGPGGSGGGGSIGCSVPSIGLGGPGTQPTQPGNSGAYGFGNNGGTANPILSYRNS